MATKAKSKDPELEINAKWSGPEFWKDWGKSKKGKDSSSSSSSGGAGGAIWFVGFIGSLVYWLQAADGFGAVITAVLKSLVWPAYIVYKLLESFYGVVN